MISRLLNAAIAITVIAIVAVIAFGPRRLGAAAPTPPAPATIVTLGAWHGAGDSNTETFTTTAPEWTIAYEATPRHASRSFHFDAIVIDASTGTLADRFTTREPGAGTWTVHARPGRYYVRFLETASTWTAQAEEAR